MTTTAPPSPQQQQRSDNNGYSNGSTRTWHWESEEFTRDIIDQLQRGEALETRGFLKPIFRCMKHGVHKSGARDAEMVEMAFAFADWMVQLSTIGDAALGLAPMPDLQPSYALNTIVTASQRVGSVADAQRGFDRLLAHGYEPDVFTYTALIDVIARSGDVRGATSVFETMRASTSRPNIVTFTTLVRAVSYTLDVDASECLTFVREAHADNLFDAALLWEALDTCAARKSVDAAAAVLLEAQHCGVGSDSPTRDSTRVLRALTRLLHDDAAREQTLAQWLDARLVAPDEHATLVSADAQRVPNDIKMVGCLGQQTSDSVRLAVMHHDVNRLTDRLRQGVTVTTNDFETLIHQCRKRKWTEGVAMVLDAMEQVTERGWTTLSESDPTTPTATLPPQPHLRPTSKTYVAIVDAYMVCGDEPLAWQAFVACEALAGLPRDPALYRKFVRGAYLLNQIEHVPEMLAYARRDNVVLSHRACVELARMHGFAHDVGLVTLFERLPVATGAHTQDELGRKRLQTLLEELVLSCAYKFNAKGVEVTLQGMLTRSFARSAATETAVFILCLQHDALRDALQTLRHFQRLELVLATPMYDSLLREMYFRFTRRGGAFDDASRKVATKALFTRRALFTQVFAARADLERLDLEAKTPAVPLDAASVDASLAGATSATAALHEQALAYWCDRSALACAALMFTQHVVEIITTIRDKDAKATAQAAIARALQRTPDPFLFTLRVVVALRFLDLTMRALGKLAKQLLEICRGALTEETGDERTRTTFFEPQHAAFVIARLPELTVHVVKEVDDVMHLHATHRADVLSFCYDALEHDNMDKTIGFIVHTPGLYTLATAAFLIPKLAELYVLQHQVTVLQFFKPDDVPDAVAMRRLFLREVIEVETIVDDEEARDRSAAAAIDTEDDTSHRFACTTKAITEFKLQHEDEFLPFLLHRPPRRPRTDAELAAAEDATQQYLALPLAVDCVVVVDSDETVARAFDVLMSDSVDAIGIDAEWRPDAGRGYVASKVAVLQIACATHVFLFDLRAIALADVDELFAHLFASPAIVKIGFALDGDIRRLRYSYPDAQCFDTFVNVLDFSLESDDDKDKDAAVAATPTPLLDSVGHVDTEAPTSDSPAPAGLHTLASASFELAKLKHRRRRQRGLASYVHEVLGLPLSKVQQRSDWEQRPLTPQQITYAALDAYCLIMLRNALRANAQAAVSAT